MTQPQPYKLTCPKCGYSKKVQPKSDVLNPIEEFPFCQKCKIKMEIEKLSTFDNIKSIFK